jgi:hypothetical protein
VSVTPSDLTTRLVTALPCRSLDAACLCRHRQPPTVMVTLPPLSSAHGRCRSQSLFLLLASHTHLKPPLSLSPCSAFRTTAPTDAAAIVAASFHLPRALVRRPRVVPHLWFKPSGTTLRGTPLRPTSTKKKVSPSTTTTRHQQPPPATLRPCNHLHELPGDASLLYGP